MSLKSIKSKILESAQKYIQKSSFIRAIDEYRRILDKEPGDISIRLRVGDLYIKAGKKEDAIKEYNEVARNLTKGGFYLKAIAVHKQVLKLDAEDIDIRHRLAELYAKQGLIADAIGEYNFIAAYFENKGKTEKSSDILKKMLEIDSNNIGIRMKLAEIYQRSGYLKDAISEYEIAATGLLKDGKYEKAERIYQGLYETNEKEPNIVEGFINIFREKGDKEQLLRYSKELVSLYGELADDNKQRESCERLLESFPDDKDTLSILEGLSDKKEEAPSIQTSVETEPLVETEEEPLVSWPEVDVGLEEVLEVEGSETTSEEAVKETVEEPVEEAFKEPVEEVVKEPVEGVVEEPVEETVKEAVRERVKETDEEVIKEPVEEAVEKTVEEAVEEKEPIEFGEFPKEDVSKEIETTTGVAAPEVPEIETSGVLEEEAIKEPLEYEKQEPAEPQVEEEYVDLSAELGLESVDEFENGIKKQLGREDTETHFNLGIAYMEMEMFDEAIKEFEIAMKDPDREFDCHIRLGLNFMAKRKPQEAISFYLKGLEIKGRTDDERKGLMYELALAYESAEQKDKAMEYFKKVSEMDSSFRDVSDKLLQYKEGASTIPVNDDLIEVEML